MCTTQNKIELNQRDDSSAHMTQCLQEDIKDLIAVDVLLCDTVISPRV